MTHVTINFMGIKIREYDTEKPVVPNIKGFLKEMKELEKETNGAIKVMASVSIQEEVLREE